MSYTYKLQQSIAESNSVLCVGLDPNLDLIPEPVKNQFETPDEQVSYFCKLVIDYKSEKMAADLGVNLFSPKLSYCTDNAAMIAITGKMKAGLGQFDDLDLIPFASL